MNLRVERTLFVIAIFLSAVTAGLGQNHDRLPGGFVPIGKLYGQEVARSSTQTLICTTNNRQNDTCVNGWWISTEYWAAINARNVDASLSELKKTMEAIVTATADNTSEAKLSREAMEKIATQMRQGMEQLIVRRFEALPAELLNDPVVRARLQKLQEDITNDIRESLPKPAGEN